MLHWFARQFEIRGPVFIIRHPCAVVASMLEHGAWDKESLHWEEAREIAMPDSRLPASIHSQFNSVVKRVETLTEALAVKWSIDHYIPLIHHAEKGFPWILVPYERLLARGRGELRRVADALNVQDTKEMHARLGNPSSSVKDLSRDAKQQLSKWHRRLSSRQIDAILNIVDQAGVGILYQKTVVQLRGT